MPPAMIMIATFFIQLLAGASDKELVERMSAEDRERIEKMFGNIDVFMASMSDMVKDSGIPQIDLSSIPGVGSPVDLATAAASGQTYTFNQGGKTFTGFIDQDDRNNFFVNTDDWVEGSNAMHRFNLNEIEGGTLSFGPGSEPFSFQVDVNQQLQDIWGNLSNQVPTGTDVLAGVDIPDYDIEGVFARIKELMGEGGFLRPGDLGRIDPESLIPDIETPDFGAITSNLQSQLRTDVQETATRQGSEAQRSLASAGIIPGSAAFETETRLAPQVQAERSLDVGINTIGADVAGQEREFNLQRAGILTDARARAAEINTRLSGIEQSSLDSQRTLIGDLFAKETGFGLQGAALQLQGNDINISNEFKEFGAQFQVTAGALAQFDSWLAASTNLTIAGKSFATNLIMAMLTAELGQVDSTILDTDILNNAIGGATSFMSWYSDTFPGSPDSPNPWALGGSLEYLQEL